MLSDREDMDRLQRETNDALGRLVLELRESQQRQTPAAAGDGERQDTQPLRDVSDALGRTTTAMQQLTDGLGATWARCELRRTRSLQADKGCLVR